MALGRRRKRRKRAAKGQRPSVDVERGSGASQMTKCAQQRRKRRKNRGSECAPDRRMEVRRNGKEDGVGKRKGKADAAP
ncbi:hypothetical protein AXF42_Ash017539 [Apostasia shenzhenica]|uniref:Uncharacterized protein n=1 Tax=Apostasia shenzhenica TaxID=1088818 RepID=A0A2I0A387_9ASPA|nr:hypothetical protein AXF42_Ash017539 [Apostasia shenzhenica]